MSAAPRSPNKSLMARLVTTFVFLLLVTVSIVSVLAYIQARRSLTQSAFERLRAVSFLKEDGLNHWVNQQRLNLDYTAWQLEVRTQAGSLMDVGSSPNERRSSYEALTDYLKYVVTSVSDSDELFILDLDGKVVVSTSSSHEGQSHAEDLFFRQGLSSTYVQPVYTSPVTNRPTITVATPLFNQDRRRVGVLAGHLNLARIDRIILERTGLGASGETYLVNPAYEFVSAARFTGPGLTGSNVRSHGVDMALSGQDGTDLYANYQGVPVIGYYNWLDERGVALMTELSQEEAFAPARQLAVNIFGVGFLSSLLLAGVAYFLARRIAQPILAITRTARQVASGDLTQTAPLMTDDEVGLLAQTFNEMTGQLRLLYEGLEKKVAERTADLVQANTRLEEEITMRVQAQESLHSQNVYLEALHETTLGLIGRLDPHDLLEDLVRRAGRLMNTEHGFIYIAEPGEEVVKWRVGVGLFNRLVGFQIQLGEGLVGTVWQTGKPMVVNDYDNWTGRIKNFELNLISSLVGVPLTTGSTVIGVLGLAYDCQDCETPNTFGENEIEQLTRFAHLASIALDNARLYTGAKEARAIAEAANEAKSAFLANVSHELRTPLTSILGFARMTQVRLQERILPALSMDDPRLKRAVAQVDDNLNIILAESNRLTKLINDLLDLEKIQAGKVDWQMQTLYLGDVIRLAATATSSLFESKNLTWVEDIAQDLPAITGDLDRLQQVVINLISNAVKFSDQGEIICKAVSQNGEVIVSVKDQGVGIAREDHGMVFEKFKQVGDTLTDKPQGTGLGLPICKEIIEVHGGRIWLESEIGQGSTFYFSLPIPESTERA
jgi:signal transduction histidine kinase/HAMP domain-containing protein